MLLIRIVAAVVIVALVIASPLHAQQVASTAQPESLRRSIAREAARLGHGRVDAPSVQTQRQRSWIGRHPVLTGALVGAAGGAVWAEVLCRGQCEGDPRPYIALFGGVGAGIGAGVGAVIAALRP